MNKKILIIQLRPGLGDLCMFLPRCHEIAEQNKGYKIYLLTKQNTKAEQVLKYDPFISKIIFIDENKKKRSLLSLYRLFKNEKFSKVYSYQYGPKYLKYLFFSKITGVKDYFYYGIFKKKEDMIQRSIIANEKWLNIKIKNFSGKIFYPPPKEKYSNSVVIGIGASGDNKRWPLENFIEIIQELKKLRFEKFILAGGKGERHISEKIISQLAFINFINMEDFNVEQCIEEISKCEIFLGNDTGFMHVSACLGLRTYCLYGDTPSNDSMYNSNIFPILPPGMDEVYHDDLAMDKITTERVIEIIKKDYL
ncbi:Glycosyltransferase family 9 (heptosyltransferase) [alpha proteobacterium HIMB59]|nr:Glycosyltransferase family 9 (heptosyltransferase) [alpha proteobacterium HIMB59]